MIHDRAWATGAPVNSPSEEWRWWPIFEPEEGSEEISPRRCDGSKFDGLPPLERGAESGEGNPVAGDWIPIRTNLDQQPEVYELVRLSGKSLNEVVGILTRFWCWAREHTEDGNVAFGCNACVTHLCYIDVTFLRYMEQVGWLHLCDDERYTLTIPKWDQWLSDSAKKRVNARRRVALHRARKKKKEGKRVTGCNALALQDVTLMRYSVTALQDVTPTTQSTPPQEVTSTTKSKVDVSLLEGERRCRSLEGTSGLEGVGCSSDQNSVSRDKEKSSSLSREKSEERKNCKKFRAEIVDAWNQLAHLHGLPSIRGLTGQRPCKVILRLKEHPKLWQELDDEIAHLGEWAKTHRFLTFDWILSPNNLAKLLEGNYRDKGRKSEADWLAQIQKENGEAKCDEKLVD
jgi:hypothetical protein